MSGKEDSSADAATTQQEQTTPKEGESKSNTESKPENTTQETEKKSEETVQTPTTTTTESTQESTTQLSEAVATATSTTGSSPGGSGGGGSTSDMAGEKIEFKVVYNKKKFDITFGCEETVGALKAHLQDVIGVPSTMQKVMIKGLAKDEMTLKKLGVAKGSKIMVVGSTLNDVLEVTKKPTPQQLKEEEVAESAKESLSQQKQHKKVLEKGPPEDVMPGIKNVKEALPPCPISGMVNKTGGKVRLTFKLELDQLWIGTKERTQKLPLNSIKTVVSEAIEGHEEYSMVALQLGPTEASRYWIYWVPNQYVEAIKEAILGKWQLF